MEGWLSVTKAKHTSLIYLTYWNDPLFDISLKRGLVEGRSTGSGSGAGSEIDGEIESGIRGGTYEESSEFFQRLLLWTRVRLKWFTNLRLPAIETISLL